MSKNSSITSMLRLLGPAISYYPEMARVMGGSKVAIFACNFLHWEGRQKDPDGWIYKTQADIETETGLSRFEQESARKTLADAGILESERRGMPGKLYYRFHWDRLDAILEEKLGNRPAKKKKAAAVEPTKEQILFRMKASFDLVYEKQYKGEKFIWGDRKSRLEGRNWGNLKKLKEILEKRLIEVAEEKKQICAITDDAILASWEKFLAALNDHHRSHWLDPALLLSNYNVIRGDIVLEYKKTNGAGNNQRTTLSLPS